MSQPNVQMVNCAGGLNLTATTSELFQATGYATRLENFESSYKGGYRRINGYTKWGTAQPSGASSAIIGVYPYAAGKIAVQVSSGNTNIYYSVDGTTWVQVNKQGASGGLTLSALNAATQTTRASTPNRAQFVIYEGNTTNGEIIICDGANKIAWFKLDGSTYYYDEVSTPASAQWCELYKDRLIVGGDPGNKDVVYWSHTYALTNFTGANAGSITLPSEIKGIKVWRDRLFCFGKYQIDEISGLLYNTATASYSPSVTNVSKNIGCINGFSIQEIGGDLVYLSIDGLRTLAGTERIDDIELGSISRPIDPLIQEIITGSSSLDISSLVIREKNQYRLFYCKSTYTGEENKGIIGTLKLGEQGLRWEWSEVVGIPISSAADSIIGTEEVLCHGGYDGYIYTHDTGNDFNGSDIAAVYTSPEMTFGGQALFTTLFWMKLSALAEGSAEELKLKLQYDFESTGTHQPPTYILEALATLAKYGTATYSDGAGSGSQYGGPSKVERRLPLNGSGYSHKFTFFSTGTQAPYSLQSYLIKFVTHGLQ